MTGSTTSNTVRGTRLTGALRVVGLNPKYAKRMLWELRVQLPAQLAAALRQRPAPALARAPQAIGRMHPPGAHALPQGQARQGPSPPLPMPYTQPHTGMHKVWQAIDAGLGCSSSSQRSSSHASGLPASGAG